MLFIERKRQRWVGGRERGVTLVAFLGGTGNGALDGLGGLVDGIPGDVLQ